MNVTHPTGLGEPELNGKLSLFQPPGLSKNEISAENRKSEERQKPENPQPKRIRTTLDLTWNALQVIQELQQQHRLKTGKVLPLWKATSLAIEGYAQARLERKVDTSKGSLP